MRCLLMGLLLAVFVVSANAQAADRDWYMGSAEAQRIVDRERHGCYERAWHDYTSRDRTYYYGATYMDCLYEVLAPIDAREGGALYGVLVSGYDDVDTYYGWSWNYPNPQGAYDRAYKECEIRGPQNCFLKHVVRNGCIALAKGAWEDGSGSAATPSQAHDAGLWACPDQTTCEVTRIECSNAR